ncbi:LysR family transcriptional regulator [Patulibacter defluvii]|uniref:LysR family transcriptional regulator n=1 Tax=Patulibacter defluvii TaxID=3095358 RepID=UPI002A757182|nr:LysR family transcriptional regulator [Patulibacter sp. DM4]
MSDLRLEDLRWFVEVAEREHVSQAAAALHVSQPALSRSVARVEAWAGVPLLDRVGRGVRLNAQGQALVEHLRRAAAEVDAGRDRVRQAAGLDRGRLRLAFQHTLGTWLVPELLARYREHHPTVDVRLREDSRARLLDALADGELDLALVSPVPDDDRLAWHPLRVEPLRLLLPPGHPLEGRPRIAMAELADESFAALHHGYGLRTLFEQLCARAGFVPRIVLETSSFATLVGLVVAGHGLAVLPPPGPGEAPPGRPPTAAAIDDPDATRTIALGWRAGGYRPPAVEAFRELAAAWADEQRAG